jgi:non-lysosomal glucosylceramidase
MTRSNSTIFNKPHFESHSRVIAYADEHLKHIGFPLGGIGTGCISLGGWGQLKDWEIMNRPAKGFMADYSFFTLRIRDGKKNITKILQGPMKDDNLTQNGHSAPRLSGEGLPHFQKNIFIGKFPIAEIEFEDSEIPMDISLTAFNPFIPLHEKDSSIPIAILLYQLHNRTQRIISGTIYGNLNNIIGYPDEGGKINESRISTNLKGLWLTTSKYDSSSPKFGTMALTTSWKKTLVWPNWGGDWQSCLSKFWEIATKSNSKNFPKEPGLGNINVGTIASYFTLKPGQQIQIPFFITWHFPNYEHWEKTACCTSPGCSPEIKAPIWKNYYTSQWTDAWDIAEYTVNHYQDFYTKTYLFSDNLFRSSLPKEVIDAVSSQLSVLKSPTCLRLEDGTFYGFEGCNNNNGSCDGSCSHVWNYAQALAYLFPNLQRSMLDAHFQYSMREDGFMQFRIPLPLGTTPKFNFHPAADGQMGLVIQVYRHWQITGDHQWLKKIWPKVKCALEFAWRYWDRDKDGVMEGMQHNTYDIEFYGPNTMMGSLYLCALRAGEEIANYIGDTDTARIYHDIFTKGSNWMNRNLFNGHYYEQKVNSEAYKDWPDPQRSLAEKAGRDEKFKNWPKWQIGKGCLSDQLIGQWYGTMLGLGYLFKPEKVKKTLKSIYRYNWKSDLTQHVNFLRIYAYGKESGLLISTWPKGKRPGNGMYFSCEVMCGIEYQVASHLIYEGLVEEGLKIVHGVRNRYNGKKRNPWNEIECGHHYSRSLASYALLPALSGFSYSARKKCIEFNPRINEKNFATFFCVGSGWGMYHQKLNQREMNIGVMMDEGELNLSEIHIHPKVIHPQKARVELDSQNIPIRLEKRDNGYVVLFSEPVHVKKDLYISLTN